MVPATLSAQVSGPKKGHVWTPVLSIITAAETNMFTPDGYLMALTGGNPRPIPDCFRQQPARAS